MLTVEGRKEGRKCIKHTSTPQHRTIIITQIDSQNVVEHSILVPLQAFIVDPYYCDAAVPQPLDSAAHAMAMPCKENKSSCIWEYCPLSPPARLQHLFFSTHAPHSFLVSHLSPPHAQKIRGFPIAILLVNVAVGINLEETLPRHQC